MTTHFDCKTFHSQCQSLCCMVVPIEKGVYERNRPQLVREVLQEIDFIGNTIEEQDIPLILPITETGRCPFLREDLACNIYDDRPKVCRKYGDESQKCLRCPFQDKNGRQRSRQERRSILREAGKEAQRLLKINSKR